MGTAGRKVRRSAAAEEVIASAIKLKKKTLALAESCTGGLVSSRITDVSGSSAYFRGGVVAYSNDIKINVLNVPADLIKEHGAVSRQVAMAMAEGARRVLGADMAAAVTGIAGPGGGTREKPVGLAYVAFVSGKVKKARKVLFKGDRMSVKNRFAEAVLKMIRENM
ncbi:MAG: CinA family protein [Candidatus Omnitrophota bacterium]